MKGAYVLACVSTCLKNELCWLHKASNRPDIDLWMVILKQPSPLCRRAHDGDRVAVEPWLRLPRSVWEAAEVLSLAGHSQCSQSFQISASPS